MEYNVYCDESCHLEHDGNDVLVLGGILCPCDVAHSINAEIIRLKREFGFDVHAEFKWSKISPGNVEYYISLVDFFFDNPCLRFRGYIGRGKKELTHSAHNQSYDQWYYKMYYRMLEHFLDENSRDYFNIYPDIKDTAGGAKINKLKVYLNNHCHNETVKKVQLIHSDEVAVLQVADVLIGALSYKHRRLHSSAAKLKVISHIEKRAKQNLLLTSSRTEKKANWFVWTPDTWR